jgi:MSHA biogenesis protein MshG
MPRYTYKARSGRGDLISGELDAESSDVVAARLTASGITPVDIHPASPAAESLGDVWRRLGGGRPTPADILLFTRQMHAITKAGVPLLQGMQSIARSTSNIVLRECLEDVLATLQSGRELSVALARHPKIFSQLFIAIVKVGETTGRLEEAFVRLHEYLARDQEIRDRVKGAVRYPIFVMVAIGIALWIITAMVIPKFAPIFRALGDDIPLPTRIITAVSQFSADYWYLLLAGIGLLAGSFVSWVNSDTGRYRWDRWRLKLPVVGTLMLKATLARICRALALTLEAGLPIIQALNIIARVSGNVFLGERVLNLRDGVERGESIGRSAATVGLFTPLVLQMISVGEETGQLPELLDEVAGFYEREVDYELKHLSDAIEPILIVIVGFMVLILALGVFLPMWDMIAKAKGL